MNRITTTTATTWAQKVLVLLLVLFVLDHDSTTTTMGLTNRLSKVRHVVMFTVRDDVPEEAVQAMKEGLRKLPQQLDPLFVSHELGTDLGLEGGKNHPAGPNRSVVWSATFGSVADYEAYDTSEEHRSVVANLIKPVLVPGSRSAIQYHVE